MEKRCILMNYKHHYQLSKLQEEKRHDEVAATAVDEDANAAQTAGCHSLSARGSRSGSFHRSFVLARHLAGAAARGRERGAPEQSKNIQGDCTDWPGKA